MTLVNQNTVLEAAQTMGEFTTRQMAVRVYGDLEYNHFSATYNKLQTLYKRGFITKLGKIKDQYSNQPQIQWRAVL